MSLNPFRADQQLVEPRPRHLRGVHYQLGEAAEVKIVRCVRGALWDRVGAARDAPKRQERDYCKRIN